MKTIPLVSLVCLLLLTSCQGHVSPTYDPTQFACTLTMDEQVGQLETKAGQTTLTMTAPAILSGLVLTFVDGNCTMTVPNVTIPLSADAAASITTLVELITADPQTAIESQQTGQNVVYTWANGSLTLDENGLPQCAVTTEGRHADITLVQDE